MRLAWLVVLCSCTGASAQDLHATFDADTQGWSLQGFNTDGNDYTVMPQLHE
jgi:hypothetical protein